MLSYWEHKHFTHYDIAVIGSGITGLSTAISLKEHDPSLSIVILEKGVFPSGASTKNAGFACVGSLTEILDDLNTLSEEEAMNLVRLRKEGLDLLRRRLGDDGIGYKELGSYELLFQNDLEAVKEIPRINNLLQAIFGKEVFKLSDKQFGFSNDVSTVIESSVEGQIDTGKMMKSLIHKAMSLGITILNNVEVKTLNRVSQSFGIQIDNLTIKSNKVALCSNAFSAQFLKNIDLQPGRGQVLITKPIAQLPFQGIYHFDQGYYYFRTIDDRVLFGGGRNIDFEKEVSTEFELNNKIQEDLESKLRETILPNTSFEIDYRWTGIMAFGATKKPIIKKVNDGLYYGVRLGGMGIAIGSKVGALLAELILNDN